MITKEHTTIIRSARVGRQQVVAPALLLAFVSLAIPAGGQQTAVQAGSVTAPDTGDVSEVGKKLSNPLSNVWALFTEFDLNFSDGNLNSGHPRAGGRTIFQPILPIPLYGEGEKEWKFITRPTIPFLSSQPIPSGENRFVGETFSFYAIGVGPDPCARCRAGLGAADDGLRLWPDLSAKYAASAFPGDQPGPGPEQCPDPALAQQPAALAAKLGPSPHRHPTAGPAARYQSLRQMRRRAADGWLCKARYLG